MLPRTAVLAVLATGLARSAIAQGPPGPALFDSHCATCHAGTDLRTPTVAALRETPDAIIDALTTGVMREQGSGLTVAERRAVAEYLSGRSASANGQPGASSAAQPNAPANGQCAAVSPFDPASGLAWSGWSPDSSNRRFQPAAQAGINADTAPKLSLKWAFGFPNATAARAQPTVAGGRVFVAGQDGTVYALDAKRGCTIWTFKARAGVRTAIVIGPGVAGASSTAYFGDGRSSVYAVSAATGDLLWSRQVDEHPSARVTGAPALYQNRLYVPVSSGEEGQGGNARYECCTFRGSLVALNASTGAVVWKTFTIPEEPRSLGRNRGGAVRWGPSGAGIWSSPTVDAKRRLVYAATGNMYTEPQQGSSDAVLAFEMETGKVAWMSQVTPRDIFVVGCNQPNPANCPVGDDLGPDFDFGSSAMLVSLPQGKDLIVIGQKSGIGWALDPDNKGAILWQYRAGKGSALGGIDFGSAADGERAYFGIADGNQPTAGELHAVRLDTGARVWQAPPPPIACGQRGRGCSPAILAAISAIPGVVFVGSNDGAIRAYASSDGSVLWSYDTNHEFATVNGVPARGASMSGAGPAIADGMVYMNSGYGALGGRPGNVLLAFGIQ